jgi:uncharacterized membrane protein YqjE
MPDDNNTSELGQAIQEVSERASLLVREEIELAKAEVTEKVTKLVKGAVVGIVAGVFAVFALVYLLHSIAWLIYDLLASDSPWLGFLIVAAALFVLGVLAGLLAARYVKRGSPPTPKRAIEEAHLIKETVSQSHPAPQGPAATTPARPEVRT